MPVNKLYLQLGHVELTLIHYFKQISWNVCLQHICDKISPYLKADKQIGHTS
jgi:hypothetical protein